MPANTCNEHKNNVQSAFPRNTRVSVSLMVIHRTGFFFFFFFFVCVFYQRIKENKHKLPVLYSEQCIFHLSSYTVISA